MIYNRALHFVSDISKYTIILPIKILTFLQTLQKLFIIDYYVSQSFLKTNVLMPYNCILLSSLKLHIHTYIYQYKIYTVAESDIPGCISLTI